MATKSFNVPYRSKLTEKIEPGQTLIVKGKTTPESKRFTLNLHKDSPDFSGNDVPLHISVRFDEGKVVFNSFAEGKWGKEERVKLPFKRGEAFDFRIRAHDANFVVYAERVQIKLFEHRIPLQHVSHLSIDGDLLLQHVQWGGKYYPVPYESGIAGDGLAVGKAMKIYGLPDKKATGFNINLLNKNGDIALQLNPKFKRTGFVQNCCCCCTKTNPGFVLLSSLINGKREKEQREQPNPFRRAKLFDLEIRNEEFGFEIWVNGERFTSYPHQGDSANNVAGLQIQGDIDLTGIQVV